MANGGELTSVKRISQVLGLLAGVATIVYVSGGVVLALRLGFEDLDAEAVVAQLPREFLITIGVATVALPALIGAAVYLGWRLLAPATGSILRKALGLARCIALKPGLMAAVLVAPGVVIELDKDGVRLTLVFWAIVAYLVSLVWTLVLQAVRVKIVTRHTARWSQAGPIALMSVLYGALLLPGSIVVGATLPLLDVKVCTSGGSAHHGSLVGETEHRLYFGEAREGEDDQSRRIVSLASANITEVFIGDNAEETACDEALVAPAER